MSQIKKGRKITVEEMAPHVHSFLPYENKVTKISDWLSCWIEKSLKDGKIKPYDFLPSKGALAFHIGVSLGTMQNVFRLIEDKGLIESKQKIGAYIKNPNTAELEKLTSKRDAAIELLKKYIKEQHYRKGDPLISIRNLSGILAIPFATLRAAIINLISDNILEKQGNLIIIKSTNYKTTNKEPITLVDKIADDINIYIKNNLKYGDKLPSNYALSDMYNVSVKTIHDAIKILSMAGIVKTRRGYYGTVVTNQREENIDKYYYEQVEEKIKKYIAENCKIGEKLPSIKNFADVFNVSAKTIKNALDNLANDGYINFLRGRFGGTFVLDIPNTYEQGYTWLALSQDYNQ